jgi:hypothetical protein
MFRDAEEYHSRELSLPLVVPRRHWASQRGNDAIVIKAREIACSRGISVLALCFV